MPAGQPTKYNDEALTKSDEYLKTYDELGDVVPTAAGLADFLGVCKKTLYNWADVNPQFLHMLNKINQKQERVLLANGLMKNFDSGITKLMLAKQGYSEKQEIDHTTKGESINKIERVIAKSKGGD
jgi:hypothetical protein